MKIAAYSTDWSFESVPDEIKSALTGKQEFIKGKKQATFGGTYYYRLAMPTMELSKHGYEAYLSYQIDTAPDGHIRVMDTTGVWHDDCDIIVFQRWMGSNGVTLAERAKAAGQIIVNDLDDDFWHLTKTNVAHEATDPNTKPDFNRDHYREMIAASSAITVSTPALYEEMKRLGPPVYLCRNAIDIERWRPHDPGADGMIGWIGGIQWRAHDMQILKAFLPEFLEDFDLPFYHGGDSNVEGVPKAWDLIGINPRVTKCATTPLCHIGEYPGLFNQLNISLIPLENVRFNHAKSALKALESSAAGIPFIASDLPEQRWFVEHGGAGRLAKNWKPQTWERHLEELLDPEVRRADGLANRKHAEQFDITAMWTQWDDAYADLGAKVAA